MEEEIEDLQSKLKATRRELDATKKKQQQQQQKKNQKTAQKKRELNPSFDWGVGGNEAHQWRSKEVWQQPIRVRSDMKRINYLVNNIVFCYIHEGCDLNWASKKSNNKTLIEACV